MTDVNEQGPAQDVQFAQPAAPLEYQQHETTLFAGQLATLLLRILAIYLVVVSLPGLTYYLIAVTGAFIQPNRLPASELWATVYAAIPLAAAGALYWFAPVIGRRMVRDSPRVQAGRINTYTAQAIAISLLGLYLIVDVVPSLVHYMLYSSYDGSSTDRFFHITKLVLGLILFLQARGLAVVWHKLRSSARYEEAEQRQEP
jgi:hypothetical protein